MKDGSLTVRLPASSLKELRIRARKSGRSTSALVRELLEKQLKLPGFEEQTALELTQRWVGAIRDSKVPAGRKAREVLGSWDPDRRG